MREFAPWMPSNVGAIAKETRSHETTLQHIKSGFEQPSSYAKNKEPVMGSTKSKEF